MVKTATFKLRLTEREKKAFQDAAELSGISLAAWMRDRLRRSATRELEDAGREIAFLHGKED
jgi:predicted HicB family RNase H-like nuclease